MNVRFDPSGPLRGRVTVPADKSISHRAALIGAMASEPVRVRNYLDAADTRSTLVAVTPCRVASVEAAELDRGALHELSKDHRRTRPDRS